LFFRPTPILLWPRVLSGFLAIREEIVDTIRIRVRLAPGEAGRFEVQLGRIPPLNQKLRSSGKTFARVVLLVDSAEFSDGTEWSSEEPVIDIPVEPRPRR
jgi:hypothetical protein